MADAAAEDEGGEENEEEVFHINPLMLAVNTRSRQGLDPADTLAQLICFLWQWCPRTHP